MLFKFEQLHVWRKSLAPTCVIRDVTQRFQNEALLILTSQQKRATGAISLNTTEGTTTLSNAEFSWFLQTALFFNIEVVAYTFSRRSGGINGEDL